MTDAALDEGVYSLVVAVDGAPTVAVGALGTVACPRGAYVYVGSARGPAGFGRIERHREVARGDREVRRWHVDYLLGAAATEIAAVVRSDEGVECRVADRHREPAEDALATGAPVTGFGASDCGCAAHLFGFDDLGAAAGTAAAAHAGTAGRWDAAWCNSYQDRDPPWG